MILHAEAAHALVAPYKADHCPQGDEWRPFDPPLHAHLLAGGYRYKRFHGGEFGFKKEKVFVSTFDQYIGRGEIVFVSKYGVVDHQPFDAHFAQWIEATFGSSTQERPPFAGGVKTGIEAEPVACA